MQQRGWVRNAPLWTVCIALCACSEDDSRGNSDVNLPHFNDLTGASNQLQTAAEAVVRLRTGRAFGTGSYISATGLLLTNNHVLGETVCPLEGCYVEVSELHQRGKAKQDDITYFARPVTSNAGLDLSVLQLEDAETGDKPSTPNYLKFDTKEADELLGRHITVVGHPEGNLKKWTEGTVFDADGSWITTTAYVLPGESGSPILSDDGKIVGLIHRAPSSLNLITEEGVNVYSLGSASAPVKAALDAPLSSTVVSVDLETTEEAFLANELFYLNSRTETVNVAGDSVNAIDILSRACDTALNQTQFASLDEMDETLTPCYAAQTWIECRVDAPAVPYITVCPSEAEREHWRSRFQTINSLQLAMNGVTDYNSISFSIAKLESSRNEGTRTGGNSLKQVLDVTSPRLDFQLAYYLAAFDISTYDGTKISQYITSYSDKPSYELDAELIAYSASWLASSEAIAAASLFDILKELASDPKVAIGAKLSIEDYLYELEAL